MTRSVDDTIRALEERLWKAQIEGDVSTLDELIEDDLLFTDIAGALAAKDSDLEAHRSGVLKILKLDPLELKIRQIPCGAITSVKMASEALVQGQRVAATLRYTRVWILRKDRWQIAGGHMGVVQS